MNRDAKLDAYKVVNTYSAEQLAMVLDQYGEVNGAMRIANIICKAREDSPIQTVEQLLDLLKPKFPMAVQNKQLAKVFQAIRIEVNQEMQVLKQMLEAAKNSLAPGGRLVVISYHSLEDRLVKNFIRSGTFEGEEQKDFFGRSQSPFEAVNRKVIIPTDEEIEQNNRARSAKLRIAEKL
jgi:16S rRNA (cytosine1402-N4)-methyltransferase